MSLHDAIVQGWLRGIDAIELRRHRLWFGATLGRMGHGCRFASRIIVQGHRQIELGRNVRINDQVVLQAGPGSHLRIGDDVTISFGAKIMTGQYPIEAGSHDRDTHHYESIEIGDRAWIAAGAIILPGVRIGQGSIIAAGAVVSSDVPPRTLSAGIPAKPIKNLDG